MVLRQERLEPVEVLVEKSQQRGVNRKCTEKEQ